ncbi:unnamed protein product [Rhodiola kirilowii]
MDKNVVQRHQARSRPNKGKFGRFGISTMFRVESGQTSFLRSSYNGLIIQNQRSKTQCTPATIPAAPAIFRPYSSHIPASLRSSQI